MKKPTRVEKKMKRRRNFFRFILSLILISLLIVFALKTDFFVINDIKVIGNKNITKDTLINASSINIGENIFKISINSAERNIKKLPYTKEINIMRKFPKGIVMEITERKEMAQIKDISSFILIDEEGQVLDIKDNNKENLPIIIGLKIKNKKLGNNIFSDIDSKKRLDFIKEGYDLGLFQKIEEVDMADNNNINLTLNEDIGVAFGTLDNVKYKLDLLDEILRDIRKDQIPVKMILMNKGDNPIIY
jgi:cell division protein FtsQ